MESTPTTIILLGLVSAIGLYAYIIGLARLKPWSFLIGTVGFAAAAIGQWYFTEFFTPLLINSVTSLLCLYGYYRWTRLKPTEPIRRMSLKNHLFLLGTNVLAIGLIHHFSIMEDPYIPKILNSMQFGIMIPTLLFLIHKKLEAWWYWILPNAVYILYCAASEEYFYAILQLSYLIIELYAWTHWRKTLRSQQRSETDRLLDHLVI